jgi:hypothetical protein
VPLHRVDVRALDVVATDDPEASALAPGSRPLAGGRGVSLNTPRDLQGAPFGRCGLSGAFVEYAGGDPAAARRSLW